MNNRLKELRKESGLRQKDVAEKIGVCTASYGFYENWINKPDPETLIKLANLFEVSIDYLLGRTDELGNIIIKGENAFDTSPMEQRLILDFRKLPAETQDNFLTLFHNLAISA